MASAMSCATIDDEGILLEIEYANLDPIAQGITQIIFDVDQDPTTGEQVQDLWGRVVMGAETSLSFIWDLGDGTIESGFGGQRGSQWIAIDVVFRRERRRRAGG